MQNNIKIGNKKTAEGFSRPSRFSAFYRKILPLHVKCVKLLRLYRTAVIIALSDVAAERADKGMVFRGLHAFDDDGDIQPMRQADGFLHDDGGAAAALFRSLPQKTAVQLHLVDVQTSERIERGITAAEVIHGNPQPHSAKLSELSAQLIGVRQSEFFENFQRNQFRRNLIFFEQSPDPSDIIALEKEEFGLIDGNPYRLLSLVHP